MKKSNGVVFLLILVLILGVGGGYYWYTQTSLDTQGKLTFKKMVIPAPSLPSKPPATKNAGYLIIHADTLSKTTFDEFIALNPNYTFSTAAFADINRWCFSDYPANQQANLECDVSEVPIWAGNIEDEYLPTKKQLEPWFSKFNDNWPSILRSYIFAQNKNVFGNSLRYVLFVGNHERFPYVIAWDFLPTMMYYTDLSYDPYEQGKLHKWDRNNDKVLAKLFYVDPNEESFQQQLYKNIQDFCAGNFKPREMAAYFFGQANVESYQKLLYEETKDQCAEFSIATYERKCNALDHDCDDTDVRVYLPEVALGILPDENETFVRDFLKNSVTIETEQPERIKKGFFAANATFFYGDNWFPTQSAAQLFSKKDATKYATLFGDGGFDKPEQEEDVPYPAPNCGYLPGDRQKCFFDQAKRDGYGFALFNTHGAPYTLSGILDLNEINNENFVNKPETLYTSIACQNLGMNNRRSEPTVFKNLGIELVRKGNGRGFTGATAVTMSSARHAFVAEDGIAKYISSGYTIGDAIKAVLNEFVTRCVNEYKSCAGPFYDYKDKLWNVFIFEHVGIPSAKLPQ